MSRRSKSTSPYRIHVPFLQEMLEDRMREAGISPSPPRRFRRSRRLNQNDTEFVQAMRQGGYEALRYAIQQNDSQLVYQVLKTGVDPNQVPMNQIPLFLLALRQKNIDPDIINLLLEHGTLTYLDSPHEWLGYLNNLGRTFSAIWNRLDPEITDLIILSLNSNDYSNLNRQVKQSITESDVLMAYMRLLSRWYPNALLNRFRFKNGKWFFKGKKDNLPLFIQRLFQLESQYPGIILDYFHTYYPEQFGEKNALPPSLYKDIMAPVITATGISDIISEYAGEPLDELQRLELFVEKRRQQKIRKLRSERGKRETLEELMYGPPMQLRSTRGESPKRFVSRGYREAEKRFQSGKRSTSSEDRELQNIIAESLYESRKDYERRTGLAGPSNVRGSKSSSSSRK